MTIPTDFSIIKDKIDSSLSERIPKEQILVFVFGPDITRKTSGANLRRYIIKKCREHYAVVLAEHQDIISIYEKKFGASIDYCNMENDIARNVVHGIIIIPDSAGSLIELGMFSLNDDIHEKILVLFNQKFAPDLPNNFVGMGAKAAYDNGKARTLVADFKDKDLIWNEVSSFLEKLKGKRMWRNLKNRKPRV
jgi:hypothetical protein